MFFSPSAAIAFFFSLFLVGQVAASPLPRPMMVRSKLVAFIVLIYLERSFQAAIERHAKRQDTVPVQVASKSDGTNVVPYKRQVPVQVASKSDGTNVVPYKRQVPVEEASKSDGTNVVPYKRQAPSVPVEVATKSDGTDVVPYKRQTPPVEEASKSDGTVVEPYKRYSEIPLELAVRSVDGVVELY